MSISAIMALIFFAGIIMIALEDMIKINKAAVSVTMCILLWVLLLTHAEAVFLMGTPALVDAFTKAYPEELALWSRHDLSVEYLNRTIVSSFGDVSSTLFFVLASMAIVEVLDSNGCFGVITKSIKTRKKRTLVWIVAAITFFLSAFLGNLATVIIAIAILRKLIPNAEERLPLSCLCVIAANAGGSFSPIGDVTTLLLWTGGNVSAIHQISHIFLPALAMIGIPTFLISLSFKKDESFAALDLVDDTNNYLSHRFQSILLGIGLLSLVMVPVMQSCLHVPPYMSVLAGLCILWVITDIAASASKDPNAGKNKVSSLFSHLDIATILFFLGVLMSVEALKQVGVLTSLANSLSEAIPEPKAIAVLLGCCSSVLDNVALVAATMGMFPLAESGVFMPDSQFWTLIAYCAVTGGSILIIGSASGVTVMGLEKVKFGYYLKKFSPLALLGYFAGVGIFLIANCI